MAGLYTVIQEGKRKNLNIDILYNLTIGGIITGIIGARLYYVLVFNPDFLNNPGQIFMIHQGGLSIQGALMGGIIFAIIYIRYKQVSFWKIVDTFAPGLILGTAIGRIGCDVFGNPMNGSWFWGVNIQGQLLHPVQIYESLLNFILFLFLWNYRDEIKYDGQLFVFYLLGYSFNRGFVEFFRENPLVVGQFTVAHITALIFILISIVILFYIRQKSIIKSRNKVPTAVKKKDSIITIVLMIISVFIYYNIYK